MSYYLDMGFTTVKDRYDALEKANQFAKLCGKNYKEMLDLERNYIPSIRLGDSKEPANEYWVYGVFTFNFVYFEKYNILGIKGCTFPEEARKMFDVYIPFQNGTDQNYDFEEWGTTIPLFNEIVEYFKNATDEEIKETVLKRYSSWDDEMEENIEYYRKSCVYEDVCNKLDFFSFLYDKEGEFERFSICGINTTHEFREANRYVKYLVFKEKEEFEQLFGQKNTDAER